MGSLENTIQLHDLRFRRFLDRQTLRDDVMRVAQRILRDYDGEPDLEVLVVLNGAYVFAADLLRELATLPLHVHFTRYASYQGTTSSGSVRELLGLPSEIVGRPVLLVEDIVDSGLTIAHAVNSVLEKGAASVRIATMFLKPKSYRAGLTLDYVGRELPNDFVVGYGMDYDGLGRNLPDLYIVEKPLEQ